MLNPYLNTLIINSIAHVVGEPLLDHCVTIMLTNEPYRWNPNGELVEPSLMFTSVGIHARLRSMLLFLPSSVSTYPEGY